MKNEIKTLWRESPSLLLLFPDAVKALMSMVLLLFVYLIQNTSILNEIILGNRSLYLISSLLSKGGNISALVSLFIFLFFSVIFLWKIIAVSYEKYVLDEMTFHFESGVLNVTQDETQLFRLIDFEVQKPFLLRIFGRGNLVIFSNDPSLESGLFTKSYLTPDGTKGMILAGIEHPEAVRSMFKAQVIKVREERSMKVTELI